MDSLSLEQFAAHGCAVVADVLPQSECDRLLRLASSPRGAGESLGAGSRDQLDEAWCAELAKTLREHPALAPMIPPAHLAVQCTFFEKSASCNWLVPVHQDLSIAVAERVESPALSGWSIKGGVPFVQAPLEVLEAMVAVRLHLEECGEADGPLRVVPGSHRKGVISAVDAASARRHEGETICSVPAGGVLLMRPLLLHASSKALGERRRRVLHFVYGPASLPFGLKWALGV